MSEEHSVYVCEVCGHEYDEAKEGKKWEDLAMFWLCPECGCHKDEYVKVSEDRYIIELAVAGFGKSEIDIELADGKLIVKGMSKEDAEASNWIHKGIANRNFTRTFLLNDNLEVKDAELFNGMLRIWLDMIIPEHKKPKKIAVKETASTKEQPAPKQLLTE